MVLCGGAVFSHVVQKLTGLTHLHLAGFYVQRPDQLSFDQLTNLRALELDKVRPMCNITHAFEGKQQLTKLELCYPASLVAHSASVEPGVLASIPGLQRLILDTNL
jgi:hypothetical protein